MNCEWCEESLGDGHSPEAFHGSLKARFHTICIIAMEHQQNTPLELVAAVSMEKSSHAKSAYEHARRSRGSS